MKEREKRKEGREEGRKERTGQETGLSTGEARVTLVPQELSCPGKWSEGKNLKDKCRAPGRNL